MGGSRIDGSAWDRGEAGLTGGELDSTANYQAKNLSGIGLGGNDLTGWDFSGQKHPTNALLYLSDLANANLTGADLTNAELQFSTLTNAKLAGVWWRERPFDTTSRGFTAEQLYATASYRARNLSGIRLASNDLSGWDFSRQDLTNANLNSSNLTAANLSEANLTNADLGSSNLTNGNLSRADLTRARLFATTLTNADLSRANLTEPTSRLRT